MRIRKEDNICGEVSCNKAQKIKETNKADKAGLKRNWLKNKNTIVNNKFRKMKMKFNQNLKKESKIKLKERKQKNQWMGSSLNNFYKEKLRKRKRKNIL